jgi:hypothetical protein
MNRSKRDGGSDAHRLSWRIKLRTEQLLNRLYVLYLRRLVPGMACCATWRSDASGDW